MKTVLHIEDDPSLRKMVRVALAHYSDLRVDSAADGLEALELACVSAPDLVLLDERLPGMSGSETFRALRRLPGLGQVPILFLTGSTDPRTHGNLIALGAYDILVKPCRPHLLVHAIGLALTALRGAHIS